MNARDIYLNLLKKTLTFSLWPEPPVPIMVFNYERPYLKRVFVKWLSNILQNKNKVIAEIRHVSEKEIHQGSCRPSLAHTMIGMKRLDNIQYAIETIIREKIEGDCIETGVWRGGACIFMRAVLAAYGVEDRKVFVADSFKGLPRPDGVQYPADKNDQHFQNTYLSVSRAEVENTFRNYDMLDSQIVFLEGWFKDTLPSAPIDKLALLRLDGDMYSSTMEVLSNLYPKLLKGGFCIIDDYSLDGCRKAVDDFRKSHMIVEEMVEIDWTGRFWRKK
jgi:O-methyltransferase